MKTEIISANEVAKRLNVNADTVREWARQGRVKSILRFSSRCIRFSWPAVLNEIGAGNAQ